MVNIIKKIKSVPSIPKTILEVMELSSKQNRTAEELVDIIRYDSLLITMLIKTANSALFGYKNKIETIENLVYLLGIDLTVSLTLSQFIQSSFDIDFTPYGIDTNQFRENTILNVNLLSIWVKKIDVNLKNELLLPITILNIGKFIIADEIVRLKLEDEFLVKCKKEPYNLDKIEKEYCKFSSKEITILLLEHWDMGDKIINHIKNSNYIDIVHNICNVIEPLSQNQIKNGLLQAKTYGYDEDILRQAIQTLQDRI